MEEGLSRESCRRLPLAIQINSRVYSTNKTTTNRVNFNNSVVSVRNTYRLLHTYCVPILKK